MIWNRSELFIFVLIFLVLSRVIELVLSYNNEKKLKAKGAVEVSPGEYDFVKWFHAFWFIFLIGEFNNRGVPVSEQFFIPLFILLVLAQIVRFWCLKSLGEHWTAKILAVPGAKKITSGPYRYTAHPTYMVVVLEFILLPLMFKLYYTLIIFSVVNLFVLANRMRLEKKIWKKIEL